MRNVMLVILAVVVASVAGVMPAGAQGSDEPCTFVVADVQIIVPPGGTVTMGEMTLACPAAAEETTEQTLTNAPEDGIIDPWEAIVGLPTGCPTDGQMQTAFGFAERDIKPVRTGDSSTLWEPCKWSLQANEQHVFENVPMLEGWQLTYSDPEGNPVVTYGDGSTRHIMGASLRYLPAYAVSPDAEWVMYPDKLLAREVRFGLSQSPAYLTYADSTLGTFECPSVTETGGAEADWTPPTWEGGAWVYNGPRVTLTTPDDTPSWVDNLNEVFWPGEAISTAEASYHCHYWPYTG